MSLTFYNYDLPCVDVSRKVLPKYIEIYDNNLTSLKQPLDLDRNTD